MKIAAFVFTVKFTDGFDVFADCPLLIKFAQLVFGEEEWEIDAAFKIFA